MNKRTPKSIALLVGLLALFAILRTPAGAAQLITFDWSPGSQVVPPGTTEISVVLTATQTGGADAAGITLGFSPSGIVTDVLLESFGAAVSSSDSFFGYIDPQESMIAVAPLPPGSFGVDASFDIAVLTLVIDTSLGSSGAVDFVDLASILGPPALKADGTTEIPADLSVYFDVQVPEPSAAVLQLVALLGLFFLRLAKLP